MASLGSGCPASSPGDGNGRSAAREFSLLWQSDAPGLDAFLAQRGNLSVAELTAVVCVDLRERWRRGERPAAEDYFSRFAQLADSEVAAVDMVYAEFLAREALGEQPAVEEFASRFPRFAQVLGDQVRLHQALDESLVSAEPESADDSTLDADYEILDELGRGGMGVVYRARQTGLNRLVALKMVRHADLTNDDLLARFRAEAEVIASLHHPHIVQVHDYGEHESCPYLALELVEGGTLADRLVGRGWEARRAAQLLEQVARAAHFAHEHGVVHRDLKPNNLLVFADGDPPQVKIADFGLARIFRNQPGGQTQTGALLGTPSYMAPEQAYGRQSEIGPATDVYALGAILYELLCGRPPYRGENAMETLQQVLLAEPQSIHRLAPGVPRDLATICSKCLERLPAKRYASAWALAEDLQRFLADRPIEARPASNWERGWRWCRRNPALAASLSSVAVLLLAVSIVSTWYSSRLSRQLDSIQRAELAERSASAAARLRLWDAYLAETAARNASRQVGQRFAALETIENARKLLPTIGSTAARQLQLRNAAIRSVSLPDLRRVRTLRKVTARAGDLALAQKRFALNESGNTLLVGNVADGSVIAKAEHNLQNSRAAISPDGRFAGLYGEDSIHVWRVSGEQLEPAWKKSGVSLSFVPDGRHAVIRRATGELLLVDVESGETVRSMGDFVAISDCCFHAPSQRLSVYADREVIVVNWVTGEVDLRLTVPESFNVQMAWHPAGEVLAIWGSSDPIAIWDLRTKRRLLTLPQRTFPQQLQFNSDGSRLLSCGLWDSRMILWDVGTGQKELEVQGFENLDMASDASGNIGLIKRDGEDIELWELEAGLECRLLPSAWYPTPGTRALASLSPDNRLLALSGERGLEIWDLLRLERVANRPMASCMAQFDRQGNLILAVDATIHLWPRHETLREASRSVPVSKIISFGPPVQLSGNGNPTSLATCQPNETILYEAVDGWYLQSLNGALNRTRLNPPDDPRKAALSSDERLAAIASWESPSATIWEVSTGALVAKLTIGRWGMLNFSPDGRWLASTPNGVQVWRTSDWSLAHTLHAQGTTPNGLGIAFSPDSRVLAIGQTNGELRFVDPETGHDWARLMQSTPGLATFLIFTSDNRTLVSLPSDEYSPARVWNLAKIRESLARLKLDWPADVMPIAPVATADPTRIEITFKDTGWTLLQNAIKAIRRQSAPPAN